MKEAYDPRPLDVWSCAMVYLTLHHGGQPWAMADKTQTNYLKFITGWGEFLAANPDGVITEEKIPQCGPTISRLQIPALKRLILRMLHPIAEKRISIQEALNDRWVKNIECCCLSLEELERNTSAMNGVDVAGKGSCKLAGKMVVQKKHNHFPPVEKNTLLQHRFNMGDGYSRYD